MKDLTIAILALTIAVVIGINLTQTSTRQLNKDFIKITEELERGDLVVFLYGESEEIKWLKFKTEPTLQGELWKRYTREDSPWQAPVKEVAAQQYIKSSNPAGLGVEPWRKIRHFLQQHNLTVKNGE